MATCLHLHRCFIRCCPPLSAATRLFQDDRAGAQQGVAVRTFGGAGAVAGGCLWSVGSPDCAP